MIEIDRSRWRRVRFGDAVHSITDRVADPSTAGVERYVGLEHLDAGALTINRWGSPADVEATKLRFKPGDVVFARRRAYQRKLGQADFEGIASAHSLVLRARPESVLPEFLPVFLSSDVFMDRAIQISVGSLSPTVNWKTLAVQEFDLPPLDEQRRIADLLWCLERAVRSYRARDAAARRAVTAWIQSRADGSSVRPLSDLADIANGRTFSKALQGRPHGDVPFFKVLDYERGGNEKYLVHSENYISFEELNVLGYKLVKPGAVVMARVGAAIAQERRRIIDRECVVDDNQLVITPRVGLNPEYLWLLLREVRFSDGQNEGVVPSVNQTQVGAVPIPLENEQEQATTVDFCLAAESVGGLSREAAQACRESVRTLTNELLRGPQ